MAAYDFVKVWETSHIGGNPLLVLLALADCTVDGVAEANHERLAQKARLSISSVARCIAALTECGQIEVVTPKAGQRAATVRVTHHDGWYAGTEGRPEYPYTPMFAKTIIDPAQPDDADITFVTDTAPAPVSDADPVPAGKAVHPPAQIEPPSAPMAPPVERDIINQQSVQAFLNAAGVKQRADIPLYWFRQEHIADLAWICDQANVTVREAIKRIKASGQVFPDLRRISDLAPIIAQAKA